jgi:hypothetical protein
MMFIPQESIDAMEEIYRMHEAVHIPDPFEIRRDALGDMLLYRN